MMSEVAWPLLSNAYQVHRSLDMRYGPLKVANDLKPKFWTNHQVVLIKPTKLTLLNGPLPLTIPSI